MSLVNVKPSVILDIYDHNLTPSSIKTIALDSKTRFVAAVIRNSGEIYDIGQDAAVALTVLRPDGTRVQIAGETYSITEATRDDETITYYGASAELTQLALAIKGNLRAQFKITSGEQELRTEIFTINNGEALDAGDGDWAGELDGHDLDEMAQGIEDNAAAITEIQEDVTDLKEDLSDIQTATAEDVGKALKVKTVTDGKVTEWEFGEAGGITESAASLLATILNNAVYETPQGDNIRVLVHKLLYGDDPVLTGITVTYNGGTVEVGTQVVGLSGLTITATYDDGTSKAVSRYTASPSTVSEIGNNSIVISYVEKGVEKTATFVVEGVEKKTIIQPAWNMYGLNPGGSTNTNTARIHSDFIDLDANTIILASGYKILGNITNYSSSGGTYWLFTNSTTGTQGQYLEGPASISLAEMKAYIESQSRKLARLIVSRIDDTNIDVSEGSTAVTLTA